MPSDQAYWIITAPQKGNGGDEGALLRGVKNALGNDVGLGSIEFPTLQAGTLSSLLTLSDSLPKTDAYFTQTVSKLLDTLRSLLNDDKSKLAQHARVNDRPVEEYVLPGNAVWKWDKGRWGNGGKVGDVVEALNKEMSSIDSIQKQKLQSYNLSKGGLTGMQRKRTGNLSVRSLVDVVSKKDVVQDSEYLETLMVAVPNNNVKDWLDKYERLTTMVVPRSSSKISFDDEYTLYSVTVFKRVKDEFVHKCRENKFLAREFQYDEAAVEKQRKELEAAEAEEKELWTDLLRLSRTNFSEAYQVLMHLKVVRAFVESVLRYGLPAEYSAIIYKPESKTALKTLKSFSSFFAFLGRPEKIAGKGGKSGSGEEISGEFGALMEQEYYDFVLFEQPKVTI